MELSSKERQIKILYKKLYNELEVRLKRNIELNAKHPEPISRDEIVDEGLKYIVEQFFNRCAARQIDVVTFKGDDIIMLSQDYRDTKVTPMEKGNVVYKGKL
jgi:hypothetical protein